MTTTNQKLAGSPKEDKPREKKPKSNLNWIIGCTVLAALMGPHLYYSFSLYDQAQKYKPSYPWPQITELWKAVVSGVIFIVLKKGIIKYSYDFNLPYIKNQDIETKEETHRRTLKMGKYWFALGYFTFATSYGYYVLKDEPWFPYYLGGKAEGFLDMFADAPFIPVCQGAVTYAML